MGGTSPTAVRTRCDSCGFETEGASDAWDTAEHPPFGSVTRCPECGSTNVHSRG